MADFILTKDFLFTYFRLFSGQDLEGLASIFDDDLVLRDWDINCVGKSASLEAVRNIFDSVDSITVEPIKVIIDSSDNSAACLLNIYVDSNEHPLKVVDFICVNSLGLIVEISAYKQ